MFLLANFVRFTAVELHSDHSIFRRSSETVLNVYKFCTVKNTYDCIAVRRKTVGDTDKAVKRMLNVRRCIMSCHIVLWN
jgi:hypothetical protein